MLHYILQNLVEVCHHNLHFALKKKENENNHHIEKNLLARVRN